MTGSSNPLVSVITPLYNGAKYIEETIQSVINQNYKNWEMIIVDDCSTDNSRDIVKEFTNKDNRIKLVESETNFGGPARPRNIGLDEAKGQYIAFLDADDIWLPEKIEKQISFIQESKADIVYSLVNVIDENSKIQGFFNGHRIFNKLKYIMKTKNILFYANYVSINSVLMKNLNKLRFTEDKNLIALEDWMFWIEAQKSLDIKVQKMILINYRIHNDSISLRKSDLGYRKALYMLTTLFLKKDISVFHYFASVMLHLIKIIKKNI